MRKVQKNKSSNFLQFLVLAFIFFGLYFLRIDDANSQSADKQLWLDYNLKKDLSMRTAIGGDVGVRGLVPNYDWNQIYFRPQYMYKGKSNVGINAGAGIFSTFFSDTLNTINEFRPNLDLVARFPDNEYFAILYRLRLEYRYFVYRDLPNRQNIRIRYLLGVESPDITVFGEKRPIYFQFFWEGFNLIFDEDAIEAFVNKSRLTFVFSHHISKTFRYEFNFILQSSRLFTEQGFEINQQIWRIRFFHHVFQKTPH